MSQQPFSWADLPPAEITLLEALLWQREATRTHLSALTMFSQSKVNNAVAVLLSSGFVEEIGVTESSGGRKATLLRLSRDLGFVASVDLGATSLDVALFTPDMKLLARHREAADVREGPGAVMAQVKQIIRRLSEQGGLNLDHLLAVGMGVPGPVEATTGLLISPPIMPGWEGYSIKADLGKALNCSVSVDNDANLMALGELAHNRKQDDTFILIKIGTGIGAGIVCQGDVYRGADGSAGEIGHLQADPNGPLCHCGKRGCLMNVAAGPALSRMAEEAAKRGESDLLKEMLDAQGKLEPSDVGEASLNGDPAANAIIQRAGTYIGETLSLIVDFYNPSRILIAGGVARLGPLLLASIRQSVYQTSRPLSTRRLELDFSALAEDSGVTGAAALALLELLRNANQADVGSHHVFSD